MKICLIGQSFDKNSGQGVYKYSGYLYENLRALNNNIFKIELGHPESSFSLLYRGMVNSTVKVLGKNCHFLMPDFAFPVLFKRRSIVTFHDIIPYIIKERKSSFVTYFKFMCNVAKKAEKIIAVSQATKNDLIGLLRVKEEKIRVIYEGVDHEKLYPLKTSEEKSNLPQFKRDGLAKERFVVGYLGGLGKRKNLSLLLEAARIISQKEKIGNIIFKIAGKGPELKYLNKVAEEMKLKNIDFVGFIPEEKLNEFYNSLDVFVFPSLYEGFGLPVLEAMACGIPVITSGVSSMKEIAEGCGILINPKSPKDLAEGILTIFYDEGLRKKLKKKGIEKAGKFTWDNCAKETMEVYEQVFEL